MPELKDEMKAQWEKLIVKKIKEEADGFPNLWQVDGSEDIEDLIRFTITRYKQELARNKELGV